MFLDYRNDKWRRLTRSEERDAVASQRQNEETAKPVELRPESKTRKWFCIILTFRRTREERFCRVRRNLFHVKTPRNLSSAIMSLTSLRRFWEIQFLHKLENLKCKSRRDFYKFRFRFFARGESQIQIATRRWESICIVLLDDLRRRRDLIDGFIESDLRELICASREQINRTSFVLMKLTRAELVDREKSENQTALIRISFHSLRLSIAMPFYGFKVKVKKKNQRRQRRQWLEKVKWCCAVDVTARTQKSSTTHWWWATDIKSRLLRRIREFNESFHLWLTFLSSFSCVNFFSSLSVSIHRRQSRIRRFFSFARTLNEHFEQRLARDKEWQSLDFTEYYHRTSEL